MGEQDPDLLKIGFVLIKMLGFREAFFKKIPKAVLVLVIAVPPGVCLAISAQEIFSTRCEVKCFSENVFVLAGFTQVRNSGITRRTSLVWFLGAGETADLRLLGKQFRLLRL